MKRSVLSVIVLIFAVSLILPGQVIADDEPTAPTDLTLVAGRDFVNLAWKAPISADGSNLTNYSVYKGTSADDIEFLNNVTANVTAYHDSHVEIGETYFYYVTAWNEENESVMSNTVVVTVVSQVQQDDDLFPVLALAVAAIALQLGIVAIWVMVRKAGAGK